MVTPEIGKNGGTKKLPQCPGKGSRSEANKILPGRRGSDERTECKSACEAERNRNVETQHPHQQPISPPHQLPQTIFFKKIFSL